MDTNRLAALLERMLLKILEKILPRLFRNLSYENYEIYEERWVREEAFIEQFQCFTHEWLRYHGDELDRTKAAYSNRWVYPVHKTNRLIREGKIRNLDTTPLTINNTQYEQD